MFIKGNIAHTPTKDEFEIIPSGYLEIVAGKVVAVHKTLAKEVAQTEIIDYGDMLIIPGFVDLHVHAPQYPNMGLGLDMELLPWLNTYTFPEEAKFKDLQYAKKVYSRFIHELWKHGTTRAAIYASLHTEATDLLLQLLQSSGLGAFAGKSLMDRNCPDYYIDNTANALEGVKVLAEKYNDPEALVQSIITNRFAPVCTDELEIGLGKLALEYNLPVQSHINENFGEIAWVKELYPKAKSYSEVYHSFGQFGQTPTIMAHCIHNQDSELELMKKMGVYAAHCPHSNTNLGSGIMPVRDFLNRGIRVGLGSDMSGGHKLAMNEVLVHAIQLSRLLWGASNKEVEALTLAEAFYLATKGGGEFFGLVGSFEPGYEADFLVIDDAELGMPNTDLEQRLQRYLYAGDDRNIVKRYVRGQEVAEPVIY